MHRWFECEVGERHANIGQAERGMIDHHVATALGAIPAVTQLAGVEFTEKLLAFANLHSLGFPQREDADRRSAITANQEPRKGISEIEGKAVRVAAKKRGQRLSFKVGTQEALFLYS